MTSSIEVLIEDMLGGGPPDEDPIPPPGIDPHPIPLNANDFPGFHHAAINNEQDHEEDWDDWEEQGHWAFPPLVQVPQQVIHDEILVDDNEAIPNSSITTTVSLSEGLLSHNVVGGVNGSDEVNQAAAGEVAPVLGDGLHNLLQAYPPDLEEHPEIAIPAPLVNQEQNIQQVVEPIQVLPPLAPPIVTEHLVPVVEVVEAAQASVGLTNNDQVVAFQQDAQKSVLHPASSEIPKQGPVNSQEVQKVTLLSAMEQVHESEGGVEPLQVNSMQPGSSKGNVSQIN